VIVALEALEAGDQHAATEALLNGLEDGRQTTGFRCKCGQSFEWPGLLEAHIDRGCLAQEAA
jgi:hypothetical protein